MSWIFFPSTVPSGNFVEEKYWSLEGKDNYGNILFYTTDDFPGIVYNSSQILDPDSAGYYVKVLQSMWEAIGKYRVVALRGQHIDIGRKQTTGYLLTLTRPCQSQTGCREMP
jgi:hypothetical protein